jgi:predicted transcriptional regulator
MKKIAKETIKQALERSFGNISLAAKILKVSRPTMYRYVQENELQEEIHQAREALIDMAEHALAKKIQSADTASIIFFLKTQGKSRGYVERQEVQLNDKPELPDWMK